MKDKIKVFFTYLSVEKAMSKNKPWKKYRQRLQFAWTNLTLNSQFEGIKAPDVILR